MWLQSTALTAALLGLNWALRRRVRAVVRYRASQPGAGEVAVATFDFIAKRGGLLVGTRRRDYTGGGQSGCDRFGRHPPNKHRAA